MKIIEKYIYLRSSKYKINSKYINIIELENLVILRKLHFLSEEKISKRSCFVNKDVMQSWFNEII